MTEEDKLTLIEQEYIKDKDGKDIDLGDLFEKWQVDLLKKLREWFPDD